MPLISKRLICLSVQRIFQNVEDSIKLAKELESTGISAIAIHGRTKNQKSSEPVNKGIRSTSRNEVETE